MKTKALTRMRNDTENKKSRADPFGMTSWSGFLFFAKMWGYLAVSPDFWTQENGKIYMGNCIGTGFVVLKATIFQPICNMI